MRDFEKLRIWREGRRLSLEVYRVTARFPDSEQFHLVSQMRRAATGIPANIAERCGLRTTPQLVRHLVLASGCCSELQSHAFLAHDLGYLDQPGTRALVTDIRALRGQIWAYIRHLRSPRPKPTAPPGGTPPHKRPLP
jgi:four helix bundle protein